MGGRLPPSPQCLRRGHRAALQAPGQRLLGHADGQRPLGPHSLRLLVNLRLILRRVAPFFVFGLPAASGGEPRPFGFTQARQSGGNKAVTGERQLQSKLAQRPAQLPASLRGQRRPRGDSAAFTAASRDRQGRKRPPRLCLHSTHNI